MKNNQMLLSSESKTPLEASKTS